MELAVRNVVGEIVLEAKKTEGHHGNPLIVIEGSALGSDVAENLLSRLGDVDLAALSDTASQRIDESCNLFLRFDKQKAFLGETTMTLQDDAIAVRVKVSAFPAKPETAMRVVREHVGELLASRATSSKG